ncbi:hypothetical protein [Amycolatopsis lurida]|uniref:MmyB family transcriptional regulator n=1 Tax=Amycolatopsis lurida TaxID=31959 RepID=UPI001300E33D
MRLLHTTARAQPPGRLRQELPRHQYRGRGQRGQPEQGDHRVTARERGSKTLRHPVAGELTLDWDALTCTSDPEQQLIVWTAEPGTAAHDGLRFLSSWAASEDRSAADH